MIRTTTTLLLAIVLLASCNQYKKTPSGVAYKIMKGGISSEKLKNGQFVKFDVEYRIPPKDSIFNSSFGHIPGYLVVDTGKVSKHSFLEIITQCSVGDSVDFVLNVDTLKKLGMLEYNNFFHQRDMIKGKIKILKSFASQVEAQADVQKEIDKEKVRETKDLQAYVAKQNIKTVTTHSGVLVEVLSLGDPAAKADSGKQAKVMYKGTFTDGKQFDTNMDPNGPNKEPLTVVIGNAGVIPGLDEGLRMFGKGGKGRIFIPAMLAYGQAGQPPRIPGYANLIFNVEIVDVTVAPPPAPPAPGLPPSQMQRRPK